MVSRTDDDREQASLLDVMHDDGLDEGRRLRDDGQRAASLNAHPAWKVAAARALEELAASGEEFTADDLTRRIGHALGSSENAIGSIFGMASRRGQIRCVGVRQSTRASRRAGLVRVWVGTGRAADG